MICAQCAAAADLRATLPAKRQGNSQMASNQYNGKLRRVRNLHARCTGCDCQHRERKS